MALPVNGSRHLNPAYYSFIDPESWLTCSGRFTHISGQPSAADRAQDRESSPVRDRRSTTVPCHQHRRITLAIYIHTYIHTYTRLTALFPGLPGWAGTRNVKPIWILLKQETVSGSGISWAICKSALRSRQITTTAPHHSVFYRPDALPAAQPTASKHWRLAIYECIFNLGLELNFGNDPEYILWITIGRKCHQPATVDFSIERSNVCGCTRTPLSIRSL